MVAKLNLVQVAGPRSVALSVPLPALKLKLKIHPQTGPRLLRVPRWCGQNFNGLQKNPFGNCAIAKWDGTSPLMKERVVAN